MILRGGLHFLHWGGGGYVENEDPGQIVNN